ncbi:MAG TPA: TVP38/TMEM64 family protein [Methylomirabilota bacterium]|nr:TVP38/TMEM64 family protein [Methylomirabilota bacterium]
MRPRLVILLGLSLALVGAAVALSTTGGLSAQTVRHLLGVLTDPVALRHSLKSYGPSTPVMFVGIQAVQVIISPIPGEATGLLGGYLFGVGWGLFYSTIGLTIGSMAAFGLARWLEVSVLEKFVKLDRLKHLEFIVKPEGVLVAFFLFLIPGFPKDILSYFLGLTPMSFFTFFVVSTLGRVPGTWWLSAQGAQVADQNYRQLVVLIVVALIVALPLYLYRDRILHRLNRN